MLDFLRNLWSTYVKREQHDDDAERPEWHDLHLLHYEKAGHFPVSQVVKTLALATEIDVSMEQVFDAPSPGTTHILHVGEHAIANSWCILKYFGRVTRTYQRDPLNAAVTDEWLEKLRRCVLALQLFSENSICGVQVTAAHSEAQKEFATVTVVPEVLQMLSATIEKDASVSGWIAGMDRPSLADFCWGTALIWMRDTYDIELNDVIQSYLTRFGDLATDPAVESFSDSSGVREPPSPHTPPPTPPSTPTPSTRPADSPQTPSKSTAE